MSFENFLEANYPTDNERLSALTNSFYHAVNTCGAFSWIGLFEVQDELGRTDFVVYVEEIPGLESNPALYNKSSVIDEPFGDLSFALRDRLILDLYFSKPMDPQKRVDECMEDLRLRYKTDAAKHLGDTVLPEPKITTQTLLK